MGRKTFTVTKGKQTVVKPAPSVAQDACGGGLYYLSNIDLTMKAQINTVYRYNPPSAGAPVGNTNAHAASEGSVAAKLKEALEKVLAYYYPLAGRIVEGPDGRLCVDCSSNGLQQGALFIEAEADGDVEDVGDLMEPDPTLLAMLVGANLMEAANVVTLLKLPSVIVQVTNFRCGGFVLGVSLNHMLLDGIAAMEFLRSWAETARGLPLSTPRFLDRSILKPRSPLAVEFSHPELHEPPPAAVTATSEYHDDLTRSFLFSAEQLRELKSMLSADKLGEGDQYTSLEALAGLVWRSWAVAQGLGRRDSPEGDVSRLTLAVDARRRFDPPLPVGFMGNAALVTFAACRARELVDRPASFAAGLVRESVRKVTDAYLRSSIDYLEATGSRGPNAHYGTAGTLFIGTWSRLEFHQHDFGWGEPAYFGLPLISNGFIVFLPGRRSPGGERRGVQVLAALPEQAMSAFQEQMEGKAQGTGT